MTDDALKDLYESVLGIRLLPHQLQILKQLRRDEARNSIDRTLVELPASTIPIPFVAYYQL